MLFKLYHILMEVYICLVQYTIASFSCNHPLQKGLCKSMHRETNSPPTNRKYNFPPAAWEKRKIPDDTASIHSHVQTHTQP